MTMPWYRSHRADRRALPLADAHYNRQKPGTPQFVPPGRCLVFLTVDADALWVSSYPIADYVRHEWAGAWMCTCFRRDPSCRIRASVLNRAAVAVTRADWGSPPDLGMVSFIDRDEVRPTIVRGTPMWGWTWIKAGWEPCGETKGGLLAFRLPPERMPEPEWPMEDHPLFANLTDNVTRMG